jgi:hypothetical protein
MELTGFDGARPIYCNLIVTIERNRERERCKRFTDELPKPCGFFAAWVMEKYYSASVVESEIRFCLHEVHEIAPPSIRKVQAEDACLSSCVIPAVSQYPRLLSIIVSL